ncbi:MAG: hypothetical protein IPJ86_01455 [Bacteroidetes bacterium]|nr:hypothetical protein [Bacteroidota bacterium]
MRITIIGFLILSILTSCEKEAGEGGNSVIKGTILERRYTVFPSIYTDKAALDLDVYIIYGDDGNAIDDRTRTSFDGSYKFEFLKKGKYKIFVYTEDTALSNFGNEKALILETEITKNNSEVNLPTLTRINL